MAKEKAGAGAGGTVSWEKFVSNIEARGDYERKVVSREAREGGILICKDTVYKCFSSRDQAEAVLADAQDADIRGIPLGKEYKLLPPLKSEDGAGTFHVVKMGRATGEFIQCSKGGAEKKFSRLLQEIHDIDQLDKLHNIFTCASEFKMRDCQFFIRPDDPKDPITFIDVHADPKAKAAPVVLSTMCLEIEKRKYQVLAFPVAADLANAQMDNQNMAGAPLGAPAQSLSRSPSR